MKLNHKQKHLAMMQASPSYAKHPETFYLEMRALETPVTEVVPTWDTSFVAWLRKEVPISFAAFCNQFEDERRSHLPQSPL